jgi:hypothetical protein
MYYRLMGADVPVEIQKGIAWICGTLTKTERIQEDGRRLKKILRIDRGELCKKLRCPEQLSEKVHRRKKESNKARVAAR